MSTPTATGPARNVNGKGVGERVELGRYTVPAGERVVYGQRVDGVVRVTDHPAGGHGRAYLIERELEHDGNSALRALVADYIAQAERHQRIPMDVPIERYLDHVPKQNGADR